MKTIAVQAELRPGTGKKAVKAIRKEGKIPGVIYGGQQNIHFATTFKELKDLIYTGDFLLASVKVDGQEYRCIVKDVQFHPVREDIVHIDFLELVDGKAVKLEVPVRFKGVAEGVKLGGKLQQNLRRVKIKVKPENLVDALWADISHLGLGQSVRVRDLEVPDGVEMLSAASIPIATIEIPRALRSATSKKEAEEAPAEAAATEE